MKQAMVTIKYEEEKLNAIKQYMGKKDADFEGQSFSRLTISPFFFSERMVFAAVWGMMETWNQSLSSRATVRLMPSMVMEPFSTI